MAYLYSEDGYGGGLYSAVDTPENTAISSWSFSIDGHPFVFIKLGTQGTYIYDVSTGKWLSWRQEGSVDLGFKDGRAFDELFLMGSQSDGTIYSFDPEAIDDYYGSFKTLVTGGVIARGRDVIECFAVYAVGNRSDEVGREISLLTSRDQGKTWNLSGTLTPEADTYDIGWRSLGLIKSPGRLFELEDSGALKSIDSLVMETA